jgi:hypothetical protein
MKGMKHGGSCKAIRAMKKDQKKRTAVDAPFNRYVGKRIGSRTKR